MSDIFDRFFLPCVWKKLPVTMVVCKCQYKNDQKVENKNVHFPRSIPQLVFP